MAVYCRRILCISFGITAAAVCRIPAAAAEIGEIMPSIYAHQKFGNDVLPLLPETVRKRIAEHSDLYHIGLQGPDIFFYYHPLSWGDVPKYGNRMHELSGHQFFGNALERWYGLPENTAEEQERKKAARAYLYGVLCHYTLDSSCHKFIDETAEAGITSHAELEGDYDRHLIAAEGRNPVCEVVTRQFHPSRSAAEAIAVFYPEMNAEIVEEALRSCVSFQRLLLCRHDAKRNFIYAVLKLLGKYDSLHPHIMNKEPDPDCQEAERTLDGLRERACTRAVSLITALDGRIEETPEEEARKQCRNFADSPEYDRDFGGTVPQSGV